ncbi:hypothetical protein PORY_000161 [Pneumocystis oryctolagi]|uniref:Uncharacterized protein n=1 Tax=Pneumocystis oryctolagi TaxID=42067 RepID=A0ACB7CGI7_9ASCO|nr:hypothetical protein PORY_000161 [Pneumocystis oryctolagi]
MKCTTEEGDDEGVIIKELVANIAGFPQNLERAVKRDGSPGQGQAAQDDEEETLIFALILKEGNLQNDQCKNKLKEYCGELTKASKNQMFMKS